MSHDQETVQYIDRCIGPRTVGTVWWSGYDRVNVEVLSVDRDPPGWELWTVTEVDLEGSQQGWQRTHCTPWDGSRDRVVRQPEVVR